MVSTAISRIDGVSTSVAVKAPVHAVATTNITLSGLQTVGGVTLDGSTLYRVLLTGQTDTTQNGIYDASTGSWTRSSDFDGEGDAVVGTLVPGLASSTTLYYRLAGTNPIIPGTSPITFPDVFQLSNASQILSTGVRYEQTPAEQDASVTPVNLYIPSHDAVDYIDLRRYGITINSTSAAGANFTAIQNAILVGTQSGCKRIFVTAGTTYVNAAIQLTTQDFTLEGVNQFVSVIRLVDTAENNTNLIEHHQFLTLKNIWLRGNWDGVTAGQLGKVVYGSDSGSGYIHGLDMYNVQITNGKSYNVHEVDGAYMRGYNVDNNTCGLDAWYAEGLSTGSFTTFELSGESRGSNTPNGYGFRLKNVLKCDICGISEQTKGIMLEGNGRTLFFSLYFETAAGSLPYIFNTNGGGYSAITIENCYLGMTTTTAVFQSDANYTSVLFINNSNVTTKPYADGNYANFMVIDAGKIVKALGVNCVQNSQYTTVGNVGAGEDTLFTYDIPAGRIYRDGAAIRIHAWGKTAANASNKTLKLYFGSSVIYNSGAVAANDKDWSIKATIVRSAGAAERYSVDGSFNGVAAIPGNSLLTENTAATITVKCTGTATSDNDITQQGWVIEFLDLQSDTF